jgi:hypothetical protein
MRTLIVSLVPALLLQGCVAFNTSETRVGPPNASTALAPGAKLKVESSALNMFIRQDEGMAPLLTLRGQQVVSGPEQQTVSYAVEHKTYIWSPAWMLLGLPGIATCPIVGPIMAIFTMNDPNHYSDDTCGHGFCAMMFYAAAGIWPASTMSGNSFQPNDAACRPQRSTKYAQSLTGKTLRMNRAPSGAAVDIRLTAEQPIGRVVKTADVRQYLGSDGSVAFRPTAFYEGLSGAPAQLTIVATLADDRSVVAKRAIGPDLSKAVEAGDLARVQSLLDAGASPDVVDDRGQTPLLASIASGADAVSLELIAHGADVNAGDAWGRSALALALDRGESDVVAALVDRGASAAGLSADKREAAARHVRCAKSYDDLAGSTRFGRAENADEFVWDPGAKAWPADEACGAAKPFDRVGRIVSRALQAGFKKSIGRPPKAPPPLVQDKYENKAGFAARVEKAKQELAAQQEAYRRTVDAARAEAERLKPLWLARAFLGVFGRPKVVKSVYDPDAQTFSLDVQGTGALAGGEKFYLVLKDAVPNAQAQELDRKLPDAAVSVRFSVAKGVFEVVGAEVAVGGRRYAALPAAGAAVAQPSVVDLSGLARSVTASEAPTVSVQYAQSPELQAKMKELESLRAQKAKTEELATLERQIADLKQETGARREYSSDVDEPGFQRTPRPNDWALIVGIESYQNELPKADFAERDADAVQKYVLALGVPPQNVVVLKGPRATQSALKSYLEDFLPKNVGADSRVYFYYSGHGAPDPQTGSAYLVPWEADPRFIGVQGFPIRDVYRDLRKLKAKEVVLAMDACFSGAGGRSVLAPGVRPLVSVREDPEDIGDRAAVFAAARGDEITGVRDDQGHGLFTYYFLKGLRSGVKDAQRLYDFLKPQVAADARRQNREQEPVFSGAALEF